MNAPGNGATSAGDNEVDAGDVSTPELTSPGPLRIRLALACPPDRLPAGQPDSTATSRTVAVLSSIRAPNTSPVIPPSWRHAVHRSTAATARPETAAARPRPASGRPPAASPAAPTIPNSTTPPPQRAPRLVVPAPSPPTPQCRPAGG